MLGNQFSRHCIKALVATVFATTAVSSIAATTISRMTPPSNPISPTATTLARFLPGQKFDLQVTVRPDAGATVSQVVFAVDGSTVTTISATGGNVPKANILPATAITSTVPGAVVASFRGYSNNTVGVHTWTATATGSNGSVTTQTGNFEVVGLTLNNGRQAKNIIIMLGDGMSVAHRTAARIVAKGYAQGKAQGRLAMDTFPQTAMVMTASLNSIVTDSAPGMANYVNGNKAQNNQEGVFPDDTTDAFDNPRIEYLSEYLHRLKGTSTGIVTTADVFDATPAANAVHTSNRGAGTGIVDQYLDDRNLTGLSVLLGGGRKWFIPGSSTYTGAASTQPANGSQRIATSDYTLSSDIVAGWSANAGAIDVSRDVIADFQTAGFTYASDKTSLLSAGTPSKLLGLFSYSNMNVAFDKINGRRGATTVVNDFGFPDQPMLDEMTESALNVLKQNTNGFVLTVEAASIDKQAHAMDSDRWMEEVIEFDRAIQKVKDFAVANPDTLVIITADHECAGAALIGGLKESFVAGTTTPSADNVGAYDNAKFPKYTFNINNDGYPDTMDPAGKLLIGYGSNATRTESWQSYATPARDSQQPFNSVAPLSGHLTPTTRPGFSIPGQVGVDAGGQATHTAADVQLSAMGRGATLFGGVMDNTDVFFKFGQAALGGAK